MPHSLKSRIKSLCYKGEITEKERNKIIQALEQQPKTETHGSTYGGVSWGGTYKPQQPCEDCISRTELLSRIDEERKHLLDIKMDGAEHVIVHHARRIIEDMPSVTPKARWIPASERLPEEYIHVLCQFTLNGMGECYLAHGVFHVVGGLVMTCNEVIAWMPLPKPYEEVQDE